MNTAIIYTLSEPDDSAIRYVGKTINPKDRKKFHSSGGGVKTSPRALWIIEIRTKNLKPIMKIIETVEYENGEDFKWKEREKFHIADHRAKGHPLLNMDKGGTGSISRSAETRAKIAKSCSAKMTPEARAHLSKINTGREIHTEEFKQKMSILKSGVAREAYVTVARQAGRENWKEENGIRTERRCVVCKGIIKYNVLKNGIRVPDLHFFMEGVGYIHNKCKKLL